MSNCFALLSSAAACISYEGDGYALIQGVGTASVRAKVRLWLRSVRVYKPFQIMTDLG